MVTLVLSQDNFVEAVTGQREDLMVQPPGGRGGGGIPDPSQIKERLENGPKPEVIVNRFQTRMFSAGLRLSDLKQVLGDAFTAVIPNDYALVREAIDRGVPLDEVKPGNKITAEIKRLVLGAAADKQVEAKSMPLMKKLKLAG